ncbi:hypothetical protein HNR12_003729 [Streptomonospora nanhaiensis]|uniref:Uncharacterized protein n=1 Tax=Streptomonospora nanhaiensis TaxID=1323731 RepID=A0A853BT00_9ACTN|nr:hypothetical protein [Streptomonospora nanhaiensis]
MYELPGLLFIGVAVIADEVLHIEGWRGELLEGDLG